jgi:hypothetical protein
MRPRLDEGDAALFPAYLEPPLHAWGYGGRSVRVEPKYGDIFDHFNVTYEYPGQVHLTFQSGQFCTFHDSSEQIQGTDSTFTKEGMGLQ